jgi:hypothetical protein
LQDLSPAALVDIDDAAEILGLPPALARVYLEADPPVATYRGRDLWLSATVHDAVAESADVAALVVRAAQEEFDRTESELRGEVPA